MYSKNPKLSVSWDDLPGLTTYVTGQIDIVYQPGKD